MIELQNDHFLRFFPGFPCSTDQTIYFHILSFSVSSQHPFMHINIYWENKIHCIKFSMFWHCMNGHIQVVVSYFIYYQDCYCGFLTVSANSIKFWRYIVHVIKISKFSSTSFLIIQGFFEDKIFAKCLYLLNMTSTGDVVCRRCHLLKMSSAEAEDVVCWRCCLLKMSSAEDVVCRRCHLLKMSSAEDVVCWRCRLLKMTYCWSLYVLG
jgi:hypothetical protein